MVAAPTTEFWSVLRYDDCMEVLRFDAPIEGTFRTSKYPVDVGGERLPEGAKVRVVYASANRDQDRFADADTFRIDRPPAELRRHIAFGSGTHACIGSALARAELRAAIQTLLRRLPGLELDPDKPPQRNLSLTINGFTSVPIRWDPATTKPRS